MFGLGPPFHPSPEQELRFSVPCLTADMWSIALPVVIHYRIADGRILAREPNAIGLIGEMLASPIAAEASRLSLADVSRRRERFRNIAMGTAAARDELNSKIVKYIRGKFGIRIVDLFINSPEFAPETGRRRLEQILGLAEWTPEQKRLLSEAYLRAEAMTQAKDAISIVKM